MFLVVSKSQQVADSICSILHILGMPSLGTSPELALLQRSEIFNTLLLPEPYRICEIYDIASSLRSHFSDAKLCKIGTADTEEIGLFDIILSPSSGVETVSGLMKELLHGNRCITEFKPYSNECVNIMSTAIQGLPLTKTETMLVNCLALAYPNRLNKDELLMLCFRPGSYTERATVRTHISIINRKARLLGLEQVIIGVGHAYTINPSFIKG